MTSSSDGLSSGTSVGQSCEPLKFTSETRPDCRLHDPDVHRCVKGDEDAGPRRHLATGRDRRGASDDRPWWLVRRAHAARREKLIVWMPVALAPQVDKLLQDQCYAYAKQAGLKEHEVQYSQIGTGQ